MADTPPTPVLADRLRDVVVSMRGELDVSRHVFRAGSAYILRDPVTFQTHRFEPDDYRVLNAIDNRQTLGQTFDVLLAQGAVEPEDEEAYYGFILDLHQRNLLSLPIGDSEALFKRFERRKQMARMAKLLGVLFLRVPLINPNRLLNRTIALTGWLYSWPAFFGWLVLMGAAGFVAFARWHDLSAPVLTVFDGGNLFMLWGALIGLKVIHEFGHAFACKKFGGHVPEMGAIFVLFTPLAYVDATDSWSFPKTRHRAVVTLGGVYAESIVGAIAVFVWAMTGPSPINTLAYQVILLATVTTALFNLNPLLRYDAYYLVSDLAGIPNLRARCQHAVSNLLRRVMYGIGHDADGDALEHPPGLVTFGFAQLAYRVVMMGSLGMILIIKFGGAGLIFAGLLLCLMLMRPALSLVRYLFAAEELEHRRVRAFVVTAAGFATVLFGVGMVPVPIPLDARGVSTFAQIETLRAPQDGVVRDLVVREGDAVGPGQPLMRIENNLLPATRQALTAESRLDRVQMIRASQESGADGLQAMTKQRYTDHLLLQAQDDLASLTISAEHALYVIEVGAEGEGGYVRRGDELVRVASGNREAVFLLRTSAYERMQAGVGDEIACRQGTPPYAEVTGTITHIGHIGSRELLDRFGAAATATGIPMGPGGDTATEPIFEVRLALQPQDAGAANSTIHARFPAEQMTVARLAQRSLTLFVNKIQQGLSE